jgi:aspartyl-tRNA(Asn)/glutamyl-tRNA(Gln) amidotransferase subunit A
MDFLLSPTFLIVMMNNNILLNKSLKELASLLIKKEISSVDLVKESFVRIETLDKKLHSFITVCDKEKVLKDAEQKDKDRTKESSIIYGIPFSMKDGYVTKDIRTTAASRVLDQYIPQYNATVYEKLQDTGAILIGKNNMDAWGHGGSTENTDYHIALNPWDTERISGGSSGGPAVSIASRMVPFAIGEDTGGSIRNPSSFCNISGLKVTYGRVSRYGAIAYASSLDSVGPMAKSVEDLAYVLECIAGHDKRDATSSKSPVETFASKLQTSLKGKKIGIPKEFFAEGLDSNVKKIILTAAHIFADLGATLVTVSIPSITYGVSIYYLIAMSETSSNLARYDGVRYGNEREYFTAETIRRIMIGTYALSAGYAHKLYKNAQKARTLLIKEFEKAFVSCDVLLSPVTPGEPRRIGELINNPLQNLLEDLYTVTANLVGIPSLAIPAGFSNNNLPIGMQLMGKKFKELELLQMGFAYQQKTDWHRKIPEIVYEK